LKIETLLAAGFGRSKAVACQVKTEGYSEGEAVGCVKKRRISAVLTVDETMACQN
jgi:hypothetical protein